jgi:hypothetical protein
MGLLMAIQYYVPSEESTDFMLMMNDWAIIASAFALFLGPLTLAYLHLQKLGKLNPGWGYSVVLLAGIIFAIILGIISKGQSFIAGGGFTSLGWLYDKMLYPLQATMFSVLGFYIASAAFRAFRIRGFSSTLLFLAAVIVMFGLTPLGGYLWSQIGVTKSAPISDIVEWIMSGPNMAGRRGVMLGIALGGIAMSLKIIFGIERAYLGGKE